MKATKNDILFTLALLFAIWFSVTAYIWVYWLAAIFSYPFGIASYLIWNYLKTDGKKRNKIIPIVLLIGIVFSLTVLVVLLIWN
ncbi:MAG: hypothetical protein EOO07_11865 [Chitinophagaceae bacterium]|nr:MAG: hypothetical protein EOO07_11865 [Chitinophagaceae bacterium]